MKYTKDFELAKIWQSNEDGVSARVMNIKHII